MAITKSAKKALRQDLKKRSFNVQKKRKMKNLLKKVKSLVLEKKTKEAEELLSQVYKVLDKTAKMGLIKKNNAGRKKSKIAKLIKNQSTLDPK